LSPTEAAAKKYFETRQRRIPNNLDALDRQADKLVGSIDAYNKSILGNDKLRALQGTAEMKGITLSEYVGQLQANPASDPTGANILSDVLKDPSVRSKRSAMTAELERAETLSGRINQDISDLSSKTNFATDPAKLQSELDFLAKREADIAEKMAKNAPDLVSKSKDDEEFAQKMKELAESMRNMIVAVVNKVANAVGVGPKAG
jgi:phage-related minor tail protein